jgi:hypothetical protein
MSMIYCVVPHELGDEVFARLEDRYRDNPNVTVIWDRRHGERRTDHGGGEKRELRDRRRRRLPGEEDPA